MAQIPITKDRGEVEVWQAAYDNGVPINLHGGTIDSLSYGLSDAMGRNVVADFDQVTQLADARYLAIRKVPSWRTRGVYFFHTSELQDGIPRPIRRTEHASTPRIASLRCTPPLWRMRAMSRAPKLEFIGK